MSSNDRYEKDDGYEENGKKKQHEYENELLICHHGWKAFLVQQYCM